MVQFYFIKTLTTAVHERQRFREQAQRDYSDFAMIGDADAELVDGILTLRIDLRPPQERNEPG